MRGEIFALSIVLATLIGLPGALFGYQAARSSVPGVRVVDVVGWAPGTGGWQPGTIRVSLGERGRLRISAADVVHGFSIPALFVDVTDILPGHVEVVEFVADRTGRFPFTCTRWCSTDHWRMRGAIEVFDPANPDAPLVEPPAPPLYQQLGIDPDTPREVIAPPPARPSARRGAALGAALPPELRDSTWLRLHSPYEAFVRLRTQAATRELDERARWDLVAFAWWQATTPEAVARGKDLYTRDCAACHGSRGFSSPYAMMTKPVDFADPTTALTASDVLLQGKALRGGMGTGMPEWGSLYTEDDFWAVIAFLRSFVFEYPSGR